MEKDSSFEQAAERIVSWAARHPLSAEEVERRYAALLTGLPPISAPKPEWAVFALGKLAVRYWKDRVEDLRQSLDDLSLSPAAAFRGSPAGDAPAASERILKADGQSGAACLKVTENAAEATVAVALWLEPKNPGADSPFAVTVFGAGGTLLAGPVECAAGSVLRFASVEPAEEYRVVYRTEGEKWQIRWGLSGARP